MAARLTGTRGGRKRPADAEPVITLDRPILLGSASPRRRALLEGLGLPVVSRPADLDESQRPGEPPDEYARRLAREKLQRTIATGLGGHACALAADTIVILDGAVLGKPADTAEAEVLIGRLQGRTHRVVTAYAIATADGAVAAARAVSTAVTFRALSADRIARYARSGEGLDKAGAYAAQGIGACLVVRIDGSYTNVVGLPLCEVVEDLEAARLLGPFP